MMSLLVPLLLLPSVSFANETTSAEAELSEREVLEASSFKDRHSVRKTLRILAPEGGTGKFKLSDREEYPIWAKLEEVMHKYGLEVDIEIVNREQYKNTIQTRLNSQTDLPEFANLSTVALSTVADMGQKALIKNIAKLLDKGDGTAKKFFSEGKGKTSWNLNTFSDGSVYWISQVQQTTYAGEPHASCLNAQIRKDWLDKLGLEMPENTEELFEVLKAFQEQDVNGNGQKDEVITIDFSSFNNGFAQWFGLVNDMSSMKLENGISSDIVSPWHQEGIKEYFEYLHKLYEAGLLDPTVIGSTEENKNIENNKASMVFNYTMATWNEPVVVGAENALYVNFSGLKAVDGITPLVVNQPANMSYGRWGFTSIANDEEANARLLDFLCSDEYSELTYLGVLGETYEIIDGMPRLLPIVGHDKYDEAYSKRVTLGDFLWANGGCFPKRRFMPMENELETVRVKYPQKAKDMEDLITYQYLVPTDKGAILPVPDLEDLKILSSISTDLETRSKELAASLILGDEDIENIDDYIAELDELGLRKLMEIDQRRLNRARELGIVR